MLTVYYSRKYSGLITGICLTLAVACAIFLNQTNSSIPLPVIVLLWVFVALISVGAIIGLRLLMNPPVMFRADHQGITIYYEASRDRYTGSGVVLPWNLIENLVLEKLASPTHGGGRCWVIICTLSAPPPFPVREHSSTWANTWNDLTISLDAVTGTVSKQELQNQLLPLWNRYRSRQDQILREKSGMASQL